MAPEKIGEKIIPRPIMVTPTDEDSHNNIRLGVCAFIRLRAVWLIGSMCPAVGSDRQPVCPALYPVRTVRIQRKASLRRGSAYESGNRPAG